MPHTDRGPGYVLKLPTPSDFSTASWRYDLSYRRAIKQQLSHIPTSAAIDRVVRSILQHIQMNDATCYLGNNFNDYKQIT